MVKDDQMKIILGVSILFFSITNVFSLFNRIVQYFFTVNNLNNNLILFFESNLLWIIFFVLIVTMLIVFYNKKIKTKIYPEIFKNPVITSTTGLLLSLDGLFNISYTLPKIIINIRSVFKPSSMLVDNYSNVVHKILVLDVFDLLMILCQIFIGIYLIAINNEKNTNSLK